jgi:DNA repair protein RadD
MAGRGFRLSPGKTDCLILDFGNNIHRHGPLDAIDFGKRKVEGTGEAAEKTCPGCDERIAAGTRVCACGFIFPKPDLKHDTTADSASQVLAKPETLEVKNWFFSRHDKKEIHSLRVTYECGLTSVSEWVCLNHSGFAGRKARAWWGQHSEASLDNWVELLQETRKADAIDAAMACLKEKEVRRPSKITVVKDGKWWRVLGREFGAIEEAEEEIPF